MKLRWLTGLLLCICLIPAQAAIYRWVDAQGKVHYGDQPGANLGAQKVGTQGKDGNSAPASEEAEENSSATETVRSKKCSQAQQRLASYQQADTLKRRGADGEAQTLTPEQQVQLIVHMQKNVEAFCSGDSPPVPVEENVGTGDDSQPPSGQPQS